MSLMNDSKRRVVVGVDLSAGAESLLRWADQQAAARHALLYAVTALPAAESVHGLVTFHDHPTGRSCFRSSRRCHRERVRRGLSSSPALD